MMILFAWLVLARGLSWFWPASSALFIGTVRKTRDAGGTVSGGRPPTVLMSGPFRYVRYPTYASCLIFLVQDLHCNHK